MTTVALTVADPAGGNLRHAIGVHLLIDDQERILLGQPAESPWERDSSGRQLRIRRQAALARREVLFASCCRVATARWLSVGAFFKALDQQGR